MAPSKQELAKTKELAESLVPGTNVIARVKGYPAWPAVIVEPKDVPEAVRKARPSKKIVVPVLFYNDNSFLWISPHEADILSKEQAVKNSKAKIKRTLKDAYAMAADPPSYEKLLAIATGQDGSESADQNGGEEEVAEEKEEAPEPQAEPSTSRRSRRARSAADRAQEQLPTRPKPSVSGSTKKRGKADTPSSTATPPPKSKKAKNEVVSEPEEDSEYVDNGTEETDFTTGGETDGMTAEDLANNQQARFALCSSIRQVIQENLLKDESAITGKQAKEVEDALKQLEDAPEIEISVARRSKLVRVVYVVLQTRELPGGLQARLQSWAEKWNTKAEPVIRGIPEELAPKEETEEPEEYDNSTYASRDTTEVPEEPVKQETAQNGEASEEPKEKSEGTEGKIEEGETKPEGTEAVEKPEESESRPEKVEEKPEEKPEEKVEEKVEKDGTAENSENKPEQIA